MNAQERPYRFDWNALQLLSLLGLGSFLPGLAWMGVFFVIFFIVPALRPVLTLAAKPDPAARKFEPPMPGPGQRLGEGRFLTNFYVSTSLMLFNPLTLVGMLGQMVGQLWVLVRSGARVREPAYDATQVVYGLPFREEWLVYNGGVSEPTSHSWDLVTQRYAYDFVKADDQLQRHGGSGDQLTDYFCYGAEVLAAADGVVRAVRDGIRDGPKVGTGWSDWLTPDIGGNRVVIEHAPNEYSVSAHLIPGSLTVKPGQHVTRGQVIGRCGHSGNSTEPHLHFHVQDRISFYFGLGLPIRFAGFDIDGAPAQPGAWLTRGQRVRHGP